MNTQDVRYLTTKELAELLRIKERKVYDLVAADQVPCVRVVGKLLFPKDKIEAWMAASQTGSSYANTDFPPIIVGSHDPLLDWALRESASGVATFFDGSHDGLQRMANQTAAACGLHIHQQDGWNVEAAQNAMGARDVVLVEFAKRERGLILAAGNPLGISQLNDISGHRVASRQDSAASQTLFEMMADEVGLNVAQLAGPETPARTEDDVARLVGDGSADVAFGLKSAAHQLGLEFLPLAVERYDLLIWRRAWFDTPLQIMLGFFSTAQFKERAAAMTGYDVSNIGAVHWNS